MTLYAPIPIQALTGDTPISYTAADFRNLVSALAPVQGIVQATDLMVSQRSAGANMSVDVAAGRAIVAGTSVAGQGSYMVRSDAVVNVGIAAADPSNPRIDLVVARVRDRQVDGGSSYGWAPEVVKGTPASSPTAPQLPASSLLLAQIAVPANAASITANNVSDKRVMSGTGDVPKWDMGGTIAGSQPIPNNSAQIYQPHGTFQAIGVTADATLARVTIRTPGRYQVHFAHRLTSSAGTGERTAIILLYDTNGTTQLREIAQGTFSSTITPVTASGSLYILAGQQVVAKIYQNTGQDVTVYDNFGTTNFTGVWVGP